MIDIALAEIASGTSQRIVIDTGGATLVGARIGFVVRDEKWSDSPDDTDALINVKINIRQVATHNDLASLPNINEQDYVHIIDTGQIYRRVNGAWSQYTLPNSDIADGVFSIPVSATETRIRPGRYYYSIDVKYPNGEVDKLMGEGTRSRYSKHY